MRLPELWGSGSIWQYVVGTDCIAALNQVPSAIDDDWGSLSSEQWVCEHIGQHSTPLDYILAMDTHASLIQPISLYSPTVGNPLKVYTQANKQKVDVNEILPTLF